MLPKWLRNGLLLVVVTGAIAVGILYLGDRHYYLVSMMIAIGMIGYGILAFETKKIPTRHIVLLSVMTALCVMGRFLFLAVPGFKPVTAIVVLTGIYFGSEFGMITGGMAALASNLLFGQGPWTPFQMAAWGLIGYIAGIAALNRILKTRTGLILYGILSGVVYSLIMDIWSTVAVDGTFLFARFAVKVGTSIPFMIIYMVSNVIFLLLMRKPMGDKLARVKKIYQI